MPKIGKTSSDDSAATTGSKILLLPGLTGNWHTGFHENLKSRSSCLETNLALHLSFVYTGIRYTAPFPDRAAIIAEYTIPAVAAIPAGQNGEPAVAAVAAVAPSDAVVDRIFIDRSARRDKTQAAVASCGTQAFQFLIDSMSHQSQVLVKAEANVKEADRMVPKDAFSLYQAMEDLHARGGQAGIKLSSMDVDRIDNEFSLFKQGDLDTNEYHAQFVKWLDRRDSVGLPAFDEATQVTKFFAKLDRRRYKELLRERENTERALLLSNLPVAELSLSQALQHVNGYVLPEGTPTSLSSSSRTVGVFTTTAELSADVKAACKVLSAAVPGTTPQSVLLALRNSTHGKSNSKSSTTCEPLMIGGRPWTRKCPEAGCDGIHPFYLHEVMTGKPCCAENQAKMQAYNQKKQQKAITDAKDKTAPKSVMVAASKSTAVDSDSDDDPDMYLIHMNTMKKGKKDEGDDDDDDDDCYSPHQYSICKVKLTW
jgi:hypothetical protein